MYSSKEFLDDYDHLEDGLEYILESVLSEEVKRNPKDCNESKELVDIFNTLLLSKCECSQKDVPQCGKCCSHGSNYVFNEEFQELVLKDVQCTPDLIYECSNICKCEKNNCYNRLVQYGPRKFLKIVFSSKYLSKGLITLQNIPKGAFICEYAGELITTKEAKRIIRQNEVDHVMNYVLVLKESPITCNGKIFLTIVNPSKKGNIGRYLNHSCDPNCQILSVRIDSPIPKIAFFSKRFINAGEEICFNYNEGMTYNKIENLPENRIPCLCLSKNCLKFLPNTEII